MIKAGENEPKKIAIIHLINRCLMKNVYVIEDFKFS